MPRGTTSLTRLTRRASSAAMRLAVSTSHIASFIGICAREALQRAAAERGEPHPRFRQRELGVVRRDGEIARSDDFHAAAEAQAVHGGDHRLPQVEPLGDAGEAAAADSRSLPVTASDLRSVPTQNARSPAPVMIATRSDGSAA